MPNASKSPWSSKALCSYVKKACRSGIFPREIARLVKSNLKITLTIDQIDSYLKREGMSASQFVDNGIPKDLIEPEGGFAISVRAPRMPHPPGWEPHVEEQGDKATLISNPTEDASPDEKNLIEAWNLDPKEWQIVGPLNCRRWQSMVPIEENSTDCRCDDKQMMHHYEERMLFYYKASLERRVPKHQGADLAELIAEIKKHKVTKQRPVPAEGAFVACIADPQLGKPDGDGVKGTIKRMLLGINDVVQRVQELRKAGQQIGTLYVFGMGDLIEGCSGFYAQQAFRVELDRREQTKVMRRILVKSLEVWAPLFDKVVVACVAGNHGENRKDGKSFTTFADNDDVAIFEQVQEILAANAEAYGHVSFVIPKEKLALTLDVCGTIVGLTHGHQAGRGNGPMLKLKNWWKDQAHGKQAIGDADILISAHYHHFICAQEGAKTHFQCPALEGSSDWFTNFSGQASPPGMLTMTINQNGWDNVKILARHNWIAADGVVKESGREAIESAIRGKSLALAA